MDHYHVNVFWRDEDSCWVADVPDLAHCSALGPSPEAALQQVQVAKVAWMAAAQASGRVVPSARYRPIIYQVDGTFP